MIKATFCKEQKKFGLAASLKFEHQLGKATETDNVSIFYILTRANFNRVYYMDISSH